jgi:hypothetical protein
MRGMSAPPPPDDDPPPFRFSWNAIYAGICLWAVTCMLLIAAFVRWRF